jgi:hypothetical protein
VTEKFVPEAEARVVWPETFRAPPTTAYPVVPRFVEETEAREDCPPAWSDPEAPRFVEETDCSEDWPPALRAPEDSRFVEETDPRVVCPAFDCSVPPIVTLPVVETFAIEVVALRVRAPVEETKVKSREEDAPPPRVPKRSWVSTPRDRKVSEDVEYLLPFASRMLVTEVSVPIVELGVLSSVEEATPEAETLNLVDETTSKFRKSPKKVEVVILMPMYVPVAEPF